MINKFLLLVVAVILLSVWIIRFRKATPYRGGNAKNMKEEFLSYGLPIGLMYGVGALKVGAALALIVGLWIPSVVTPVSVVISILMLSAVAMHIKIKDPIKKSMPALFVLILSITLVGLYS